MHRARTAALAIGIGSVVALSSTVALATTRRPPESSTIASPLTAAPRPTGTPTATAAPRRVVKHRPKPAPRRHGHPDRRHRHHPAPHTTTVPVTPAPSPITPSPTAPPAPPPAPPAPTPGATPRVSPTPTPWLSPTPTPTTAPSGAVAPAPSGIGAGRPLTQPDTMPRAATSGTPLIKQVRGGAVVATYTSFDAAFARSHVLNNREPGDVFEVYPAVYAGLGNYPYIGPMLDAAGVAHKPTNITVRGVTVNGVRPVLRLQNAADYNNYGHGLLEIDQASGLLWENIDVDGTGGTASAVDRSGIYVMFSKDVTIRNARIHGFKQSDNNGVFGAGGNSGTLWLDGVRLSENGGWDGPSHNVYINASDTDPNFTAKLTNSYSTQANVGHLFKSRAQVTVLQGNLLEGTNTPTGWDCAESFDLDVPEGGRMTVRDNVFVKARSGACGNGIALRYGAEKMGSDRAHSITVEHNTFIARTTSWDGTHPNIAMGFYSPLLVPTSASAPAKDVTVTANRFEGFPTTGLPADQVYRGTNFVEVPAAG